MIRIVDVATSTLTTIARLGSGARVGTIGARPEQPLQLYEFESCPFCRKVREAFTVLDLDAIVYPCPKRGPRYRPELIERGGKAQFPYLVDPNTDTEMYESDAIVRYLFEHYGDGQVPLILRRGPLNELTTMFASLARPFLVGRLYRSADAPGKLLELYSYEASPFCRIVRERLTSLELPHYLHNVARGSAGRAAFVERSGKMMVPYLVDPNTGTEMFESAAIVSYLEQTYRELLNPPATPSATGTTLAASGSRRHNPAQRKGKWGVTRRDAAPGKEALR